VLGMNEEGEERHWCFTLRKKAETFRIGGGMEGRLLARVLHTQLVGGPMGVQTHDKSPKFMIQSSFALVTFPSPASHRLKL